MTCMDTIRRKLADKYKSIIGDVNINFNVSGDTNAGRTAAWGR